MARLTISLLGPFRVTLDGQQVTGFKSNRVRALLAYLATEADRPHRRETLAGLLWPNWPDRDALSNLRYALSSLRQTIKDPSADPPFLLVDRDSLAFNPASDSWVDVLHLAHAAQETTTSSATIESLEQAAALYQGSFLEGFSLEDSPAFEEWTLMTRERLARQAVSLLHALAQTYEQRGTYDQAQTHVWRQLELEPWDESARQQLMRLMMLSGQRSAALAQYESFRALLQKELGVEPDEKTTQLYEQIRDGKLKAHAAPAEVSVTPPRFLEKEPPRTETPIFVARQKELAQLDGFLNQALAGQGCVVFATGEAGSGKTSLLQAFMRQAQNVHSDLVVASGDCNAYTGIGDPYLPFREIMDLLTGSVEAKWAAGSITKEHANRLWNTLPLAVQALTEVGPDLIDTFLLRGALLERATQCASAPTPWLARLNELLDHKPAAGFSTITQQQGNLFEQFTNVLFALAQHRPLLLVLDDLQWADLGSIGLLFHLGRHLTGRRILAVGAYRPEEVAAVKDGQRHPLEPVVNELRRVFGDIVVNVGQAEDRAFIDSFLDSEPNRLGAPFRDMLYQQTRGHPLFTIELLRGLQERGNLIQAADGCWVEGSSLDWETLPVRVEAAIRERIGRIPEELRRALAVACVEGELFTAEVVARIRGIEERNMLDRLSSDLDRQHRLIRAHSITRVNGQSLSRYRFRHILFQKYLYSDLDEVERAHLHEQIGTTLEELYGTQEQASSNAVQLALHFQKAGIMDKAIYYLHQAGTKAVQLSAYVESKVNLNKAMNLLMTLPNSPKRAEQELVLQLALGLAWMGDIPGPEWGNAITRARELCQQTGKTSELILTLGELALYHFVRAEYRRARELAEETLQLAERAGDVLLVTLGHWHLGVILTGTGDYLTARAHLEKVLIVYDPKQHHQPFLLLRGSDAGVSALAYKACCLWCLGYPDQARKCSQEALALAREFDHAFTLADVLCFGGCLFNMMYRDIQTLKESAEELTRLSNEMGFSSFGGTGACYLGYALAKIGQGQDGMAQICEGLTKRQSIGARCFLSGIMGGLTEAQALTGRPEEGLATLAEVLSFIDKMEEHHWEAELYRLQGELLLAQGKQEEAEASMQKAVRVARQQSARSWELRSTISLCRLWKKQGKIAHAHRELSDIYNWFTEGFDSPDLVDARKLLAELST